MAILIDSSVIISLERRGYDLSVLPAIVPDDIVAIADITASELLYGVLRANTPTRRQLRSDFVEGLLSLIPAVSFDRAAARAHAEISSSLRASGITIGAHDLLIAATALAHGYAVITEDAQDFRRVEGLRVITPNWT